VISSVDITVRSLRRPWMTSEQVEQGPFLERVIVEIARDPYLVGELVFRGSTSVYTLHLSEPRHYGEDSRGVVLPVLLRPVRCDRYPDRRAVLWTERSTKPVTAMVVRPARGGAPR
jgi:hypothetical protein